MTTIIDNIILIAYLDAGCIAETYLTKRIGSNKLYATKRIDVNLINREPCLKKHIENEITILKNINHRNIVKLYNVKPMLDYIYLEMEYCNGGTLSKVLRNYIAKNGSPFTEEIIQFLMKQILSGVECLHQHGIIHRDLKLDNILLKYNSEEEARRNNIFLSEIKIIDFDISFIKGSNNPSFMNPILRHDVFNEKEDIWALGVLCYEMFMGKKPYKEGEKDFLNKKDIPIPTNISSTAQSFLSSMLQKDIDKRLSANELLKSDFITKNLKELKKIKIPNNNIMFKAYTPIATNKTRSIFRSAIKEEEAKNQSIINSGSLSRFGQISRNNIQPRKIQFQATKCFQPALSQQIKVKTGINIYEANIIIHFCKYFYQKMKGGIYIPMTIADAIQKKLGHNWLVIISNLKTGKSECNCNYNNISLLKKKEFLVFVYDNNLFQVCRY